MTVKKKEPLISVIIPVYKVEKYLARCLDSVIDNYYKNLEIICVNDGSPDRCSEILAEYSKKDSRIIVIDQENQGVAKARNAGLKNSHGDYIAFIDSDDYIHLQYFETMVHCAVEKDADIIICNVLPVMEEESIENQIYKHIHYSKLNPKSFFSSYYARHMIWARLFKKRILEKHSFSSDVRYSDDTLFNLEVIFTTDSPLVYETNTPLYYYLQRENSIVHTTSYIRLKDISDYYLRNIAGNKGHDDNWGWMLTMQVIKSTLSYRYMVRYRPDSKTLIREANNDLRRQLKDLMAYSSPSFLEKIIHIIMYLCPALYRSFRIINDPTMLDWEKKEKAL